MSADSKPSRHSVEFRLYEELNDFLPKAQRRAPFKLEFDGTRTVEELLESIGIPQGKVDLILVAEQPVSFTHRLSGGERIAVFPVFERFDISPAMRLGTRPLRHNRFALDASLEKLARLLRLAGMDCHHSNTPDELAIIAIGTHEKRTLLSRDPALLKNGRVTHGYWVQADDPPAQFREILEAFKLRPHVKPFSRCMDCNGQLCIADDDQVMDRVPFSIMVAFDEFWQCEGCHKAYWKGSHYTRLMRLLDEI